MGDNRELPPRIRLTGPAMCSHRYSPTYRAMYAPILYTERKEKNPGDFDHPMKIKQLVNGKSRLRKGKNHCNSGYCSQVVDNF